MKKIFLVLLLATSISFSQEINEVFQYSTIGALMNGNFDGSINFKELSSNGDFGIGTLDNLDGEMIALDGSFYQISSSGKITQIPQTTETPFAMVTFFKTNKGVIVKETLPSTQVAYILNELINKTNYPVAIKISGVFENIKTRSVPAQKPPYPTLSEAAKHQSVFNFTNSKGTLVGFYFPKYFEGVNMPGYHFHYISDDKQQGGHVMDYTIKNPLIIVNYCKKINIQFLDKFKNEQPLTTPNQHELEKIEK